MIKFLRKILAPLIWIKNLQGNIVESLTRKAVEKTGADKSNKFKEWKFKQPVWKQFFIELFMLGIIIYIIYLLFGYVIIPLG